MCLSHVFKQDLELKTGRVSNQSKRLGNHCVIGTFRFIYSRVTMVTRSKYSITYKYQGLITLEPKLLEESELSCEHLLVYFLLSNHGNGPNQIKT